jgi:hypothetical protein
MRTPSSLVCNAQLRELGWVVVARARSAGRVCRLWISDLGDGRDHIKIPGHEDTVAGLVPGDVVGNGSEERCQCFGAAARIGLEEVRDSLDLAAQIASCDGEAWA